MRCVRDGDVRTNTVRGHYVRPGRRGSVGSLVSIICLARTRTVREPQRKPQRKRCSTTPSTPSSQRQRNASALR